MLRALALTLIVLAQSEAAVAQPARPCSAAEDRQFDFWIGRWEVFDTVTGAPAGHSQIEPVYDGCAIRESWSEPGFTGGSLNHYSPQDGRWRQTWTDSQGAWREFVGGWQEGRMVLVWRFASAKAEGGFGQVRMTFTPKTDGTVRQYSDQSADGGRSWKARYDYTYRRARDAP